MHSWSDIRGRFAGSGTIQFFAQAQDSNGNVLAQSEVSQIAIYLYQPPKVTVAAPVKPSTSSTPTPSPTPAPAPITSTPTPSKTPPGPTDHDGDGFYPPEDCDNYNPEIHPGAPEEDNGLDENCNGKIDEGCDWDGDGYTPIAGGDCNDKDPTINPGAPETPQDGIDSNCNGEDNAFIIPNWPKVAILSAPPPITKYLRPRVAYLSNRSPSLANSTSFRCAGHVWDVLW